MLELHTERLSFRTLVEADWPLFYRLHREPKTMRYVFGELADAEIRRGFEHRLPAWTPHAEHWLCLVASERGSGQAVGVTGFRIMAPGHAEVGTLLVPEHQGRGYGTDCRQAIIGYARDIGLESLESTVTDGNVASCRVLEKCGFVFERRVTHAHQIDGQWFDDLIYRYRIAAV
ncbi:GNAT family N-acetyltransferase [Pseudomonas sp. RIT-PI-S]|uniref:GNAT family N-acetyltransferase n=1 Tax=Pseudomonas sp. RIT-PI-S TaxID=3035295 RepID=UPI0021D88EA4|nr:GNAT family N-acetyltransferase [Pseudomonas sp. RIT-PI-S]